MIEAFMTFMMWWALIGFGIWFLKVFVYFRGVTNYLYWMLRIIEKDHGKVIAEQIGKSSHTFVITGFVIHAIIGPAAALGLAGTVREVNKLIADDEKPKQDNA